MAGFQSAEDAGGPCLGRPGGSSSKGSGLRSTEDIFCRANCQGAETGRTSPSGGVCGDSGSPESEVKESEAKDMEAKGEVAGVSTAAAGA